MQMTMKRCFTAVLTAFALCFALVAPQPALAEVTNATASVELRAVEGQANQVDVFVTTNQVDATTMHLAVTVKTDSPEYVNPYFVWNTDALDDAEKSTLFWDEPERTSDGYVMDLYAGDMVNTPFRADARAAGGKEVRIGTVVVDPSSSAPLGESVGAIVEVVPSSNTISFAAAHDDEAVVGTDSLQISDPVQLTVVRTTSGDPEPTPIPNNNNSDILGETPATNVKGLPSTGDQMVPIVITLVCAAVLAAAVVVVMVMRRRSTGSDEK